VVVVTQVDPRSLGEVDRFLHYQAILERAYSKWQFQGINGQFNADLLPIHNAAP
jgi:hypothetical protein